MHKRTQILALCAALTLAIIFGASLAGAQTTSVTNGVVRSHSLQVLGAAPSLAATLNGSKLSQLTTPVPTTAAPPKPSPKAVPEPSTLTMLLGSLVFGGLVFGFRR